MNEDYFYTSAFQVTHTANDNSFDLTLSASNCLLPLGEPYLAANVICLYLLYLTLSLQALSLYLSICLDVICRRLKYPTYISPSRTYLTHLFFLIGNFFLGLFSYLEGPGI